MRMGQLGERDRPGFGVRLEGVFRSGHAHGQGVVIWDDILYG